jgi:penicillin amidase
VIDFFVERIDPADPGRYATPDGWAAFETSEATIAVKNEPADRFIVRKSRHGPIVSDAMRKVHEILGEGQAIALSWVALRPDDGTAAVGFEFAKAGDWASFVEASRNLHAPHQTIVYADVDGNIGYLAPGRVPVRDPSNTARGRLPVPGWEARYDWQGSIPFDDLPREYNPPSGMVVAANHKLVPPDYEPFLTADWALPYRARRIRERLEAQPKHDMKSFQEIQADLVSIMVREGLPLMLTRTEAVGRAAEAVEMLHGWDGEMSPDRPEPLIFSAWYRELTRAIYADELGDGFEDDWKMRPLFVQRVLERDLAWCDDRTSDQKETCRDALSRALDLALQDLTSSFGEDMGAWRWGDAHQALNAHRPLRDVAIFEDLLNVRVETGGRRAVSQARRGRAL